jgi:hypothetical protein
LSLLRRLASVQFWGSSPVAVLALPNLYCYAVGLFISFVIILFVIYLFIYIVGLTWGLCWQVAFFCLVFSRQSEETLRSWIDQCATELAQDGWFRSAFLMFLRYADTPASRACYQPVCALLSPIDQLEGQAILSMTIPDFVARPLQEPLHSRTPVTTRPMTRHDTHVGN